MVPRHTNGEHKVTKIVHKTHDVINTTLKHLDQGEKYRAILYYITAWPLHEDLEEFDMTLMGTEEWTKLRNKYSQKEIGLFDKDRELILLHVAQDLLKGYTPLCSAEECERGLKKWISLREYPHMPLHKIMNSGAFQSDQEAMISAMCVWEEEIIPAHNDDPDFLFHWEHNIDDREEVLLLLNRALERWLENVV